MSGGPAETAAGATWRAGIVQLEIRTHREEDNRRRAAELVGRCAAAGCRLVVLPEAFQSGLDLPRSGRLAEAVPGPGSDWLARLAVAHRVHLAAGLLERHAGKVYSSAVLVDDGGRLLARHRRNFVVAEERPFIAAGDTTGVVVPTALGRIGLLVGYELHFPEVSRPLFAAEVEVMVCPAQLLRPFAPSIRILALSRATENCCHLLLASATGENTLAKLTFMGGSLALQSAIGVRPYSDELRRQEPVLAEAGTEEGILTAEVAIAAQRRLHAADPLYRDLCVSRFAPPVEASRAAAGRSAG